MFIKIIILSILSGILYNFGGRGKDGALPWLPKWLFNSKVRDIGCSLCFCLALRLLHPGIGQIWAYALTFGLSWAAISAYWKGKAVDMKSRHWFLHGLGIGLAAMPLAWVGIAWWLILARAVILGLLMMWISDRTRLAWLEENARGFLIILTLLIFKINLF